MADPCPLCAAPLSEARPQRSCANCGAEVHEDCLLAHGACPSEGCRGSWSDVGEPAPPARPPAAPAEPASAGGEGPGIELRASEGSQATCSYCRTPLADPRWRCGACAVEVHAECALELGRCPTLGCEGKGEVGADAPPQPEASEAGPALASASGASLPEPAPPAPGWGRVVGALGFLCLLPAGWSLLSAKIDSRDPEPFAVGLCVLGLALAYLGVTCCPRCRRMLALKCVRREDLGYREVGRYEVVDGRSRYVRRRERHIRRHYRCKRCAHAYTSE